ncbi:hypothetical protein M405DRAFT_771409 [Rhizopogon salebrosus TDB-379]|nr:hypothetical protein M405DRAFT_771409 [Rhizopogon salebrosus TDB-379]
MDTDFDETYVLLLLADSNLPTGSFVASSGFESYGAHGFLSLPSIPSAGKGKTVTAGTIAFVQDSLHTYAQSALPFVSDAHRVVDAFKGKPETDHDATIKKLLELDELYETMTLNHVAKRASKAQGVALLTLYSKGFSCPSESNLSDEDPVSKSLTILIDRLKLMIRGEETHGHMPVCWGVLTSALGISLLRTQHLYLFLHARSILSSAVRLNTIGPYSAQQLLLHSVRPLVEEEASRNKDMCTGIFGDMHHNDAYDRPSTTWPLGEILAVRHDLQHSRIFNS